MSTAANPTAPLAPAAPPPHPNHAPQDFPSWLPAMLVKELRQGLRARGFVGAFVGFQAIMAMITVFAQAGGTGSSAYQALQGGYWAMLGVLLLGVTPARALGGLRAEIDSRAIDLMLLTRLTAWRIVLGKWISLLVQAALLVITLLPYGIARYFFGSVDLVLELKIVAGMFAGCSVLTAAALWASALPLVTRVVFAVLAVFGWQFVAGLGAMAFGGRRPFFASASGPSGAWPIYYLGGMVLIVCLVAAVRRLAPPADNHAPLLRAVPLLALPGMLFADTRNALALGAMTVLLTLFLAMIELARGEEPLAVHWRNTVRHRWRRPFARFIQPGWASAFEWVLAMGACACVLCLALPQPWNEARRVILGVEALVVPALILSALNDRHPQRVAGYILILGAGSLIAAVAVATGSAIQTNVADSVLAVLPIAGFWMSTRDAVPSGTVVTVQLAVAAAIFAATWWRTASYRCLRRMFAHAAEKAGPGA